MILLKATGVPIDRYSYEAVELLKDIIARWKTLRALRESRVLQVGASGNLPARAERARHRDLSRSTSRSTRCDDRTEVEYLNDLPTSFVLPNEAVDRLRAAAGTIIGAVAGVPASPARHRGAGRAEGAGDADHAHVSGARPTDDAGTGTRIAKRARTAPAMPMNAPRGRSGTRATACSRCSAPRSRASAIPTRARATTASRASKRARARQRGRASPQAVDSDFGDRSEHETRLAELYIVASEAADAQANLRKWMRPRARVARRCTCMPGRALIERQPLGVAGIISPWNYPVQLALAPAIGALAAGNRVMLKPSEVTPATSELLRELVAEHFAEDEFAVVLGDAEVGRAASRSCRSTTCSSPARPRSGGSSRARRPRTSRR